MGAVVNQTHAPFLVGGSWTWLTWSHDLDLHAAIVAKAAELGAASWDASQASHMVRGSVVFGHPTVFS
jgi:hypothetical protein